MAMGMATRVTQLLPVLPLVLVLWPSCLHARSTPGGYDTAEYVPTEAGGYEDPAPDSFDAQSYTETFTAQDTLDIRNRRRSSRAPTTTSSTASWPRPSWISRPTRNTPCLWTRLRPSKRRLHQELRGRRRVPAHGRGGVHPSSVRERQRVLRHVQRGTVYRANDDGPSLASTDLMNATATRDTLASLAKAMGGCGSGISIDDC